MIHKRVLRIVGTRPYWSSNWVTVLYFDTPAHLYVLIGPFVDFECQGVLLQQAWHLDCIAQVPAFHHFRQITELD